MKINSRRFVRNGVALLSAFAMAATSALPASASSPDESTSTTAADSPTTTVPTEPSTTMPGATTTIPGSADTTTLPLYTGPTDANGIDQPPADAPKPDVKEFPAGEVSEKKSGADLSAALVLTGAVIPSTVLLGVVHVGNFGNEDAGAKAPVSFSLDSLPTFVKLLDVNPIINTDSLVGALGWDCNGVQCVWVEKTAKGIKNALLKVGIRAQADLRFDIAADAVIPVPEFDVDAEAKSKGSDLPAVYAVLKKVAHLSVIANKTGDVDPTNNETVAQLRGFDPNDTAKLGSTKRVGDEEARFAGVYIDSKINGPVFPGGPFHMELRFLPQGTESQSGKVIFSDVVAPALALTDVKVSGAGWTCDSVTSPKTCTRTGGVIKAGTFTDALIIDGRVGKTAPISEKLLTWKVNSKSTTVVDPTLIKEGEKEEITPIEGSQTLSVNVTKIPQPDLVVRLVPRDQESSISPPGSLIVDALVRSAYGPAQDARLLFSMRKGLSFKGLDAGTAGWTCKSATPDKAAGDGGSAQECVKAEMESDEPETVSIIVGATEETEAGPAQVIAGISAANEAEKYKAGNRVAHTLVVQPLPAPMPGLVFTRPDEKGVVQAVSDGSATKVLIGKDSSYAFSVKNQGSKALAAGSVVRFEQFVDDTAIFSGAAFASVGAYSSTLDSQKINTAVTGKWVCITGNGTMPKVDMPVEAAKVATALKDSTTVTPSTSAPAVASKKAGPAVRCEIKLASAIAPDAATPVLNLTVRASEKAKVGSPEWPVFASMVAIKQAPVARFGMTVAITEFAADLVPSFIAPAGPRPGGDAVATLNIKNSGNADASAQFLVVPGIKDGRITGIKGESWKCARLASALAAGFTICSRSAALKAGADSPSLSINYASTNKKTSTLNLQAASLVATSRNIAAGRTSKLPVALRPALAFTVKGPKTIVDQLVDVKGNRVPSTILLSTEGNGDGAVYSWKQLCTTADEVKASNGECKTITPVAQWFENSPSTGPTASLITPKVTTDATLLFDVTATEGGASSTVRASIVVVPLTTVEGPTGESASGGGSSVLHRVPMQSVGSTRALSATAPTSGTGDATFTTTSDAGVSINGNVFGGTKVTVAQSGSVSLTATATGAGAITYAWSQASGPNPSVIASAVTNTATLAFTAPAANTTISLRIEATDSRGVKASEIITVLVGTGGTAAVAAAITEGDGPIVVDTASAFTLNATATGAGAITYAWSQVSGTPLTLSNETSPAVTVAATGVSGSATLLVTATDASGAKASDLVVLRLAPSGAPAPLCDFVAAASSKSLTDLQATIDSIGISGLDLTAFAVSSSTCTAASKVSFADATFSLGSYLTVSGASGSVSAAGLTIRTARFTAPEDWGSPQFAIATTDAVGLFIPFSRAGVAIGAFEGEIIAASMPFLKLPAGYTASSALRFSINAEGTKAVSLDAEATSAAVNGKTPTARVFGAISTNGTFALEGSMTNAVNLFGVAVDFAGKVTKTETAKKVLVNLSGSLTGPITLTPGFVLNALSASRNETGVVTGSGTVTIGTAPSALELTTELSYTDEKNHSLKVMATTPNGSWTAAKDVVIPLKSASGSYANVNGARDIAIKVVGGNSTPMTGLEIKSPSIEVTAKCAADAACALAMKLSSMAEITLGSTVGSGNLEGSFDTAAKSASFTAKVASIEVAAGLELSEASLAISATKVGAADQTTSITMTGSMNVFGTKVSASAAFSKENVLLSADVKDLAAFGADGPVLKAGQLVWSLRDLSSFTPKVPSLPTFKSVPLSAKVPRLIVAIAMPAALKEFTGASGEVSDLAVQGEVNFSSGEFSLAALFSDPVFELSGTISNKAGGDKADLSKSYLYNLTGKVKRPIELNSVVQLSDFAFTFGNTVPGGKPSLSGNGAVGITVPGGTVLTVKGTFAIKSSTDYAVTLSVGATSSSFEVGGGDPLVLGEINGSFTRNATGTSLLMDMSSAVVWKPVSGITIQKVTANAAFNCATGAKCIPTFNVKGTLGFDIGIDSLSSIAVEANLDSAGVFVFTAKFSDMVFSPDVKLTSPTIVLTVPPAVKAPATGTSAATTPTKTAQPSVTAKLSGTVELFGTKTTCEVTFGVGVLMECVFPKFKLPGFDYDFDIGKFAWMLKAPSISIPSINWSPSLPNLNLPSINLGLNVPRLSFSLPMPEMIKEVTGTATFGPVSISGSWTFATGALSMTAAFKTDKVEIDGSISRPASSKPWEYALVAKVISPVEVIKGVMIDRLDIRMGGTTTAPVKGSGQLSVATDTGALLMPFTLNYTSATNYEFVVATPENSTASWTPFSGFSIPLKGVTGTVVRKDNVKTMSIGFKSSTDYVPFPGLKITEPGVLINATCNIGTPCDIGFGAQGKLFVDLGNGFTGPTEVKGSFNKGEASLSATFTADINIASGVTITKPGFSLAYTKAAGVTAGVSGSSNLLGTTLSMGAAFSSKGVLITAGMKDWTPVPGMTLSKASFALSSYDATGVVLAGAEDLGKLNIVKATPVLIASFNVPSWLREMLKQPNLTNVPITIPLKDLAGGKLPAMKIMLPTPNDWFMYKSGGSSMRFTALGFEVSGLPTPSMSLIGQAEMLTGAANETPIPLEMRGTVTPSSISLSMSLGLDQKTGKPFAWSNAFGISELTLTEAAIQVGITLTAPMPLPSLGIAATAQLPSSWRSLLNMDAGVAVRLVANIDVSKPCFQLQAGTLGADKKTISAGTAKVASIAGGALTSTYMNITIAPIGCTVGNVVVEPGVSAGFVGTVFGTNVSVNARISSSPFSLVADMSVGSFNVGAVKIDETRMGIKVSATDNFISFAGGVTIGNTKVAVSGKAGANLTDGPFLDMTGSISNLVIVPSLLEVSNAQVTMNLKPLKGVASIVASGNFNILGSPGAVALNIQMSNYQLQSLTASVTARRIIANVVTIDGTFNLAYSKGAAPTLNFNAAASVAGYALGTVTGRIDGNQVSILGTVNVGGVFSAQIGGQVVWQAGSGVNITNRAGQSVAAAAGDFRFAATNIGMNLGGFGATGNVAIGRAQGVVYGDFNASFTIGAGDVGGTVYVAGSFGTDGNFSFTGSGSLSLVAFGASVSVSGYKSGGSWGFSMSSNITVMGSVNVGFSGNFYKSGSTTRFTMRGSAALNAAGIGGGSGNFRISNEPGQAGVYADVSVNIAGISGGGSLWVGADGTFDTSIYVGVNLPGVSTGGWVKIGNVAWWNGQRYRGNSYFQIDAWLNFAGLSFRMWGNINGDGSFRFTASAGPWSSGQHIHLGVVQLYFGWYFQASLTISSYAPYVSISMSGSAYMDWNWPSCWWNYYWTSSSWWGVKIWYLTCGWGGWGRAYNLGIGFNTSGSAWVSAYGRTVYIR